MQLVDIIVLLMNFLYLVDGMIMVIYKMDINIHIIQVYGLVLVYSKQLKETLHNIIHNIIT